MNAKDKNAVGEPLPTQEPQSCAIKKSAGAERGGELSAGRTADSKNYKIFPLTSKLFSIYSSKVFRKFCGVLVLSPYHPPHRIYAYAYLGISMNSNQTLPRILLVDDHKDTVELMAFFLVKSGYEVVRAYCATEARLEAVRNKCQIVISDGRLPDGDGVELIRELKVQYAMEGILVSGTTEDFGAFEAEGFKCLSKPLEMQDLLDALQSLELRR